MAIHNPKSEIVLLAVTGMSPAVLSETVWALAQERPPVIPDRVVVITTISGRQAIERELLLPARTGRETIWQELRKTVLGPGAEAENRLMLEPAHLIVAPNSHTGQSAWLEDIRTPSENSATANFILEEVRRFVEAPGTFLIASVAGGRKTMGALLYACLSLLGRETDRLTHVLVNDPYDTLLRPRFYFPYQSAQELVATDGKIVIASKARIDLADVPFVALRNLFDRDFVKRPASFAELVIRCRRQVAELARKEVRLSVFRSRRLVEINGAQVELSNLQHLLLLFLAETAATSQPPLVKYSNAIEPLRDFGKKLHEQHRPNDFTDWRHHARLPDDFDDQALRKRLNELKNKFRNRGSEAAAIIPFLPIKGRFSLDLPAGAITIKD